MKVRIRIETEFGWGERRGHDISILERSLTEASAEELGLSLAEGKVILREIQRAVLQDQVEEITEIERVCQTCQTYLPIHDHRSRRIDTLFGRVTVQAPRVRICMCRFPGFPECTTAFSPLTRVLPGQATPEFCKLQADLAARHSFREAARLLNALTPCARQNHTTIRNRLASVADGLQTRSDDIQEGVKIQSGGPEMTIFLDSAYVRSRPEYQKRNFEVIVGSIESKTGKKHRFGLSLAGVDHPLDCLKSNLKAAGWRPGSAMTVLSDGDPALPRLVRNAINGNVEHILDWWHISARIRHVETTFQTLLSQLDNSETCDVEALVERLRWRIWHGQTHRALEALRILFRFAIKARDCAAGETQEAALSAAGRTMDLQTYLTHNLSALVNYGHRRKQGKAVSTSRAEGLVNEIANVRMGKKQRMRWSPRGAHRVATVRAAVLDGRLLTRGPNAA